MKIIITGGAGFIGCNAALRYMRAGHEVVVADNLSRKGGLNNLEYLRSQGRIHFELLDLRSAEDVSRFICQHQDADRVIHLAAQVAVTTSVVDPRLDFEVNVLGTFNLLEALRTLDSPPPVLYSSTNKVYGELSQFGVKKDGNRYRYVSLPAGVSEEQPLDFHSPYGCSKGAADQYMIDYRRIYGLKTIVFRQSCIYGFRQFGMEDQGWVAWFMIASQLGRPVTVYGDGAQVRDVLFVDDLLDAYDLAFAAGPQVYGQAYNIGGGPSNVLSVLDVVTYIAHRTGRKVPFAFDGWRPGDQRVFVSDVSRARRDFGWEPRTNTADGLGRLFDWVQGHLHLFGTPKEASVVEPRTAVFA